MLEKARQQESDMAEGLNRVMLLGNLGADPELRVTPGGQSVLKLRLATTESYVDKGGTRQERTDWHRITVWGKRGEAPPATRIARWHVALKDASRRARWPAAILDRHVPPCVREGRSGRRDGAFDRT